ncbi:MAG: WYL domain-containing protein [Eubacteriales bacterium]
MAKSENQKLKLLVLKDYLERHSDEEHPVTVGEIIYHLQTWDISAERKSIYRDLACLTDYGMDIISAGGKYFLGDRPFQLSELRFLVDSCQSSKFLSRKKSKKLIDELCSLTTKHQAAKLQRQVTMAGRVKTGNEEIYYNVDKLHDAIATGRTIQFRYFDWDILHKKQYRNKKYEVSPHALCSADDHYYLIATTPERGISHYRVDKMTAIQTTDTQAVTAVLDLSSYGKSVFSMFHGEFTKVKFSFSKHLLGIIYDRFGMDIMVVPDGEHYTLTTDIAISPLFFSWVTNFGKDIQLLYPQTVILQYQDFLSQASANYTGK